MINWRRFKCLRYDFYIVVSDTHLFLLLFAIKVVSELFKGVNAYFEGFGSSQFLSSYLQILKIKNNRYTEHTSALHLKKIVQANGGAVRYIFSCMCLCFLFSDYLDAATSQTKAG